MRANNGRKINRRCLLALLAARTYPEGAIREIVRIIRQISFVDVTYSINKAKLSRASNERDRADF